jgi:hypothetical protein
MDSCKQEALRLVSELIDAAHGTVLNEDQSREDEARAALLAHIQRGAVPDMYDRIAEAHDASLDEDHTGCRAILKECMRLLAAAPAPDQFRDATKMMAEPADPDPLHLSRILHELAGAASLCWEPRPTGVFDSQLAIQFVEQALAEIRSRMTPAPAEVPMPKPVAYGFGNTAITGHTNRLMMVRIDIPGGDQYAGAFWLPLVLADEAHTYGVACRAAGEAAGYARGLRDAVRDADIEALRLYVRALCKAVDAATDFIGTVAGGASWWDDVWADHAAALDRARERISQAALRGEVKP